MAEELPDLGGGPAAWEAQRRLAGTGTPVGPVYPPRGVPGKGRVRGGVST